MKDSRLVKNTAAALLYEAIAVIAGFILPRITKRNKKSVVSVFAYSTLLVPKNP